MEARGPNGEGESDDWFSDVEPAGALESDPPSAEDDWLVQPEPARRARPELQRRRIVEGLLHGLVLPGSSLCGSANP